jgi:uncharacterized damage-inducible protein DinB
MTRFTALALLSLCGSLASAQGTPPTLSQLFDRQLAMAESDLVPLMEAMPAEKFAFAPKEGAFEKVRTFQQQATHTTAVLYAVCSSVLAEKNPTDMGTGENGPASIKTKEDAVKYAKDAFGYCKKAFATLTNDNFMQMVPSPWGDGKTPRANMVSVALWHTFDHYGQMVVYARMNGVVPPASKQ